MGTIFSTATLNGRHRLSAIRDANAILYMENDDVKEVGTHESLMELKGKYAALHNSQFA